MNYIVHIPDADEKLQVLFETFCQENEIPCNKEFSDFVGRGFTIQELIDKINELLAYNTGAKYDKKQILKFFTFKDIAIDVLSLLRVTVDDQFTKRLLPEADNILELKLSDYSRRSKNLEDLIRLKKQMSLPHDVFRKNYSELEKGVEPIRDAEAFIESDTSLNGVSLATEFAPSQILLLDDVDDFDSCRVYLSYRIELLDNFRRRVNVSLFSDELKQKVLDCALVAVPLYRDKERVVPGSFDNVYSFCMDLMDACKSFEASEKSVEDIYVLKNKAFFLAQDYAKKFPDMPLFTQSAKEARNTAAKVIRHNRELFRVLRKHGYVKEDG